MDSPQTDIRHRRRIRAFGLGLPLTALVAVVLVMVPAKPAYAGTVTVQPGQTLSQVAAEEGVTVAALAAANGISNPNLVDAGTVLQVPGSAAPASPAPAPAPAPTAITVTVQPGQTLSGLAAQYGITVAALTAANGISNPDLIVAGSVLQIPGSGVAAAPAAPVAAAPTFTTVEVQPGQTLSALAVLYNTTTAALVAANGISNPNRISAGMVLRLPGPAAAAPAATGPTPAAATVTTVGTITVHRGDTLTSLAAHYGTTPAALAAANGISNPNIVFAGMVLKLPAAAVTVTPAATPATAAVATGAYPTALLAFPDRLALQPDFAQAATASGVPESLLEALCWWESGWQTTAVSPTGALGVCQILPSTAAFISSSIMQRAPLDPRVAADNIDLSAAYLRYLLNTSGGNAAQALADYSQGATSVASQGISAATQTYVTGILAYAAIFAGNG
jgi:LysM repeat protein